MTLELSARLLATEREMQSLLIQLWNTNATVRGYQRMVEGRANDLYTSDMDTWFTTSIVQGSNDESSMDNHSPTGSRTC
jgi:hypothetical protein